MEKMHKKKTNKKRSKTHTKQKQKQSETKNPPKANKKRPQTLRHPKTYIQMVSAAVTLKV